MRDGPGPGICGLHTKLYCTDERALNTPTTTGADLRRTAWKTVSPRRHDGGLLESLIPRIPFIFHFHVIRLRQLAISLASVPVARTARAEPGKQELSFRCMEARQRRQSRFVAFSCRAIPAALLLFRTT